MELQIFKNEQFGEVRTADIKGEVYFNLNDCCKILELSNPRKTLERLNPKGVTTSDTLTAGGIQQANFINESNFYKLVFQSRKPEAEKFADWVTSEVLPSIRKNGAYVTNQKAVEIMSNPNALGEFLQGITNQVKQLELQNSNLVEKNEVLEVELLEARKQARYLDVIIESKGAVRVTQIAADYGMSANRFNKLLHELGVQHKVNGQWILYKKYMGKGYTDSTTFDYLDKNGQARANMTTTWTQKGRLFLYELLKNNDILPLIEQDEVA
ncbi:TPA: phage antirepressor [Streptococcus suis]|nr:phage antirepressor [Streptococcus suis]